MPKISLKRAAPSLAVAIADNALDELSARGSIRRGVVHAERLGGAGLAFVANALALRGDVVDASEAAFYSFLPLVGQSVREIAKKALAYRRSPVTATGEARRVQAEIGSPRQQAVAVSL